MLSLGLKSVLCYVACAKEALHKARSGTAFALCMFTLLDRHNRPTEVTK